MVATAIMLVAEVVFAFPQVNEFFINAIDKNSPYLYIILWLLFFLQTNFLNIPAYTILVACVGIGLETLSFGFILLVISAYMFGVVVSYWLGRKLGAKALKWCAGSEEDFNKWCSIINNKGKWWYFATIILPIFPDDILIFCVGATKMNFFFTFIANLIGRSIGLITMLFTLKFVGNLGGDFPIMPIVWAVALIGEIITLLVLKKGAIEK